MEMFSINSLLSVDLVTFLQSFGSKRTADFCGQKLKNAIREINRCFHSFTTQTFWQCQQFSRRFV